MSRRKRHAATPTAAQPARVAAALAQLRSPPVPGVLALVAVLVILWVVGTPTA